MSKKGLWLISSTVVNVAVGPFATEKERDDYLALCVQRRDAPAFKVNESGLRVLSPDLTMTPEEDSRCSVYVSVRPVERRE